MCQSRIIHDISSLDIVWKAVTLTWARVFQHPKKFFWLKGKLELSTQSTVFSIYCEEVTTNLKTHQPLLPVSNGFACGFCIASAIAMQLLYVTFWQKFAFIKYKNLQLQAFCGQKVRIKHLCNIEQQVENFSSFFKSSYSLVEGIIKAACIRYNFML